VAAVKRKRLADAQAGLPEEVDQQPEHRRAAPARVDGAHGRQLGLVESADLPFSALLTCSKTRPRAE
jgi:hypothetical protein